MQAPSATLRPLQPPVSTSNRLVGIVLAVALNVAIIYLLASGLGSEAVKLVVQNIDVAVIEPPPDVEKPPPPPPPVEREPPPFVPPPDINIDITEAAPATTAITNVQSAAPTPAGPAPQATAPVGGNQNRVTRNDYPPVSARLNEEGVCIVKVTVSPEGAVMNAELVKSSGHPRLDEAAVRIVKARFRYKPAKDAQGRPTVGIVNTKVTWQLH